MRIFLLMLVAVLALATMVSASPVDCPAPPPPAQTAAVVGAGVSGFSFACAGLVFNNFFAIDAGGTTGLEINLVTASFDSATGFVVLGFNPNMASVANQDLHLLFNVTGGINQIDLTVGGSNSAISERACLTPIDAPSGTCTGGTANQLGIITNVSGAATVFSSVFPTTTPVFIFKDVNKGAGGELTAFSQSFHIPEPMTFVLLGSGLIWLARRARSGRT